jgi:hypothetical protein
MNNTSFRFVSHALHPASERNTVMNTKTLLALACAGLFAATAISAPVGVTVNGVALDDVGATNVDWTYAAPTLTLSGTGPFTLSGSNTAGKVCVVAATGVTSTVTVSNLTLMTTNKNQCVFTLETNAVVSLVLAGTNSLASGRSRAGLEVAAGRTLYITNAPGDTTGALMATGGDEGAGIGGGSGGAGGAITISGGIVTANGSEFFGAGIGGGAGGGGGAVTISGGAVTANGGEMGAGIGTGGYAGDDSGVVIISGGAVTANGGNFAAGIGGGDGDAGGTTTITGGEVSATGGKYGAGIGGGNNDANTNGIAGSGGTVNIAGGRVTATGGKCAAGIGGGTGQQLAGSTGAVLAISGGTVFATGGAGGAPGIGPGLGNVGEGETGDLPDASGWSRFTGGSIRINGGYAAYAPSNGTARVWCVTVPDLTPNAPIVVTALNPYGVNDLFTDNSGKLYLWLPNANYDFTAGGVGYEATVANADTTATPKSPTPPAPSAYITFSSANAFTIKPQAASWNGTLEYSTDTTNWALFTTAGAAADNGSGGNYRLYLRGANNTQITGSGVDGWTISAPTGTVACSGNIETLLDYATVTNGSHPAMANYCFAKLFYGCAALNSAPALPATNLTIGCYNLLFYDCTGLLGAPELPAMTMAGECYGSMFRGCTSLTNTPNLPATTLAPFCYYAMFSGCVSLTETPVLPAMTMMMGCYSIMFSGCTSLTETPALSAMTLADYCYDSMFRDCTGLTRLPTLPATNLTEDCYRYMFTDCTGIVLNEAGPGTPWGIPAGAQAAANWNQFMLNGTGGDFTDDPVIGVTYYLPLVAPVAPSGVSASDGTFTNKIRITWNASELATGYTVWRHTANSSAAATKIGSTTGTTYDDVATVAKTTYYYWVKATNAAGVSGFSTSDSGWRAEPKPPKPAAPTGVAASDGAHTDKIRVTWKASVGATSYKVYRYTSNNPNAASLIGTSASTAYNDKTAKTGLTYYYWVKAVNESGASGFSAADTGYLGVVGPLVTVNGMVGNNIRIPANRPINIAVTMMNLPRAYLGVPVDWWVAAYVHQGGLWFYFDTNFNLVQFDGNLANCHPAYQGPLYNVPPLPLVEKMLLPRGTYNVWFAVDYPMDGKIDLNGLILLSAVTIVVE